MIQNSKLPEYLDASILKRIEKEKTAKEFYIFAALCPEYDRNILCSSRELNVKDFERLQYFMYQLGFESLRNFFLNKYAGLLEELGNQIQKNMENHLTDVDMEIEQCKQWDRDFISQLPSETLKIYIQKAMNCRVGTSDHQKNQPRQRKKSVDKDNW